MKDRYVSCYFSGRFDAFDGEIDTAPLIEKVHAGLPLRDVTMEAARRAITAEMDPATKIQWLNDNLDDIKTMGGDTEKSWRLYGQGRMDALAHQLEDEVLNSIEEEDEEGDEEEEEEDEDEEEEDEEEEDEDEDEEPASHAVASAVAEDAEDGKGDFYVTDELENELFRRRTMTAAKRLALKLVRERKYRLLEVHQMFRGRLHMQGRATHEGWSRV